MPEYRRTISHLVMCRLGRGVVLFAAILLMTSCGAIEPQRRPQGAWLEDTEVRQRIAQGEIFAGHLYYYLGSITAPDAFIAIDQHWQLQSRLWADVAISEQRLNGWLQWYRTEHLGFCDYKGGRILAPDGSQVGYWYAQNPYNTIYVPEPGVIEIYRPHAGGGRVCGEPNPGGFFLHGGD